MLHAALEMQVWTWESLRTLMGLSEQVHSRVKDVRRWGFREPLVWG